MITTKRLVLKPYSDQDKEDIIQLLSNEKIRETYIIPDFKTREEAVSLFQIFLKNSRSELHYEYGIYKDNRLIGWVNEVDRDAQKIELGYVIHPDHHNNGYATEVLEAVIQDLWKRGYTEITAGAFSTNAASMRVMEKCGMKRTAREEDMVHQNRRQHCIYYSISRPG